MYTRLMYAMMLCMKLVSWKKSFIECTVSVDVHALNLNNQYLTLLYVYKPAARSSTLHTVLVMCTTSCRVVQLMYRRYVDCNNPRTNTTLCTHA